MKKDKSIRARLLEAWEPPPNAGEPIGLITSSFNFDPGFFEEELVGRFLCVESSPADARPYLVERETRLGEVPVVVLADRRHVARTKTLAWDLLGVPVVNGCCQHAKVSVLAWKRAIRLIVGSANLTEAAYRSNLETFCVFDFTPSCDVPYSLLESALQFLTRLVNRVPSPVGTRGPSARAVSLISAISGCAESLELPNDWSRGGLSAHLICVEPGINGGVLDQMSELWGGATRPDMVWICSPFWAEAKEDGVDPIVAGIEQEMAPRGDRAIRVLVPGEPESSETWLAFIPDSVERTGRQLRRMDVSIEPVPRRDVDESRPLHAKLLRWCRGTKDLLMVGSSNATCAGLGIAQSPRNIEANVCFEGDGSTAVTKRFDACFPAPEKAKNLHFQPRQRGNDDDEGGAAPIPLFFAWAVLNRTDGSVRLDVQFNLHHTEPSSWSIRVPDYAATFDRESHAQAGRSETWSCDLDLGGKFPPSYVEVAWTNADYNGTGILPVNALEESSRCNPDVWKEIDLESLLDALAETGPLYRALNAALQRQLSAQSGALPKSELDPHRRVDTSNFLMPRMRRISRALEGLRRRLSAEVPSEGALDWRFSGPLSPTKLAQKLCEQVDDPAERAFLLAELLLAVAKARKEIQVGGLDSKLVSERFQRSLDEIRKTLPRMRRESPLGEYLKKALELVGP